MSASQGSTPRFSRGTVVVSMVLLRGGGSRSKVRLRLPIGWSVHATVGLAVLACVAGVGAAARRSIRAEARHTEVTQALEALAAEDPARWLVAWGAYLPYEALLPLEPPEALRRLRLLSIGWLQNTPVDLAMKRRAAIGELSRAIYERDDILLVSGDPVNELLAKYVWNRHGMRLQFRVHRREAGFTVFHVSAVRGDDGRQPES